MSKTYRYQSIDEVLPHCYRSFSLPLMMCDCSSAPRMLTTLQHQRTYCVFRMIMYLAVVVSVLVCIAPSAHAQSCTLPTCFMNGPEETLCISCPVGFGVEVKDKELMLCSNFPPRNTKCEPCIAGVNFSDTNDLGSQCSECLVCHSTKQVETKQCTAQSDRECICKEGQFYYNVELKSCFPCTTCGEGYEETRLCTPTENRACGLRSVPHVTTTPVPPTTNQTMSTSIVSTDPPDTGTSTKAETSGKHLSAGEIAAIFAISVIGLFIAIIVCIFLVRRGIIKCPGDICTGGEGRGDSPLTLNCCIGVQTNKYNNPIPTISMNGVSGSNGTAHYQQVPDAERNGDVGRQPNGDVGRQPIGDVGRQPNGDVGRQHSATSSTTEETEHQQSVEDALEFSADTLEHLIIRLEDDALNRNAHLLASEHFSHSTYNLLASSNASASDVLKMWVRQGKTKAELTQALRDMGRDDVADICEEDSAGS